MSTGSVAVYMKAGHHQEGCCFEHLRMSGEAAVAFPSLPEEHDSSRNGMLERTALINGAVIKQMRPVS